MEMAKLRMSAILFSLLFAVVQPHTGLGACGYWSQVPDYRVGNDWEVEDSTGGDPPGVFWFAGTSYCADHAWAFVHAALNYDIWNNDQEISCGCSCTKRWNWHGTDNPDTSTFEVQATGTVYIARARVEASNNMNFGAAEEDSECSVSVTDFLNDDNQKYACGSKKQAKLNSYYLPGPGTKEQSEESISVKKGPDWVWEGVFKLVTSYRAKADMAIGGEGSKDLTMNFTRARSLGTLLPEHRPRTISATGHVYARAYAMSYTVWDETVSAIGHAFITNPTLNLTRY
jgi:hypothetical protein